MRFLIIGKVGFTIVKLNILKFGNHVQQTLVLCAFPCVIRVTLTEFRFIFIGFHAVFEPDFRKSEILDGVTE